ncbi:metal-dependent hydrolase [Alteromonas antoniana]|uniref:metal-dependent hydrolase n=1 Tax=Alteromonas antoniana TaxID=2803813 RepID=UPI001C44335B|nr:metal-dependent hydrolase [Alteromonas antoniana]
MATPLVHACAGVILLAIPLARGWIDVKPSVWLWVLLAMFLACLPDFDIIPSYLIFGDVRWHYKHTHSLLFCVLAGLLIAAVWGHKVALLSTALIASHLLIDALTGLDPGLNDSYGIPALLPFSREKFGFPVTLFQGVYHDNWLSERNIRNAVIDIAIYLPLIGITLFYISRKSDLGVSLSKKEINQ